MRTSKSIKAKRPLLVKAIRLILMALLPMTPFAPPSSAQNGSELTELPEIEAKTYDLKVVRHSKSRKIYLFDKSGNELPDLGRILLLKTDSEPVMAFRVMRNYPERSQFAAKRVRVYRVDVLPPNSTYLAVEKVADVVPPSPTAQDQEDLKELEMTPIPETVPTRNLTPVPDPVPVPDSDPAPDSDPVPTPPQIAAGLEPDPTLQTPSNSDPLLPDETSTSESSPDTNSSDQDIPGPEGNLPETHDAVENTDKDSSAGESTEEAKVTDQDEYEEGTGQAVLDDEFNPDDLNRHWLSAQFGLFRNYHNTSTRLLSGGGFRYGFDLAHSLFVRRSRTYDSLTLEGGVFLYKMIGYFSDNDAFTLLPLIGTIRYNVIFGSFGIFVYGGAMRNFVLSQVQADEVQLATLNSHLPAFGVGLTYEFGPHWEARFDLGYDVIGTGIMLRF